MTEGGRCVGKFRRFYLESQPTARIPDPPGSDASRDRHQRAMDHLRREQQPQAEMEFNEACEKAKANRQSAPDAAAYFESHFWEDPENDEAFGEAVTFWDLDMEKLYGSLSWRLAHKAEIKAHYAPSMLPPACARLRTLRYQAQDTENRGPINWNHEEKELRTQYTIDKTIREIAALEKLAEIRAREKHGWEMLKMKSWLENWGGGGGPKTVKAVRERCYKHFADLEQAKLPFELRNGVTELAEWDLAEMS
ncbi:hypothetical protein P154DRAFT_582581 [Amniculicola lignicola CBS 123094]|uniref:Uncharacterized protein n=1 Tax=Amniculicola lignicola CBS 123094 TaxID=1392246 RepID=A0A6A5W3G4_9PLEO|nr:hypothetical protein P154DRAFT_582581 [Amniculicola lignicola CBS 123094]